WSSRFLGVFIENAGHPFYLALGKLASLTLAKWQTMLSINTKNLPLHR
ncbi:Tat proofreading chaperone DmsD, partial [Salmonella enterica subsp. enterica serovar London]|nr:Tat proofreading chaperone DmsD [Salmonella enterica subsp. enterica serovar London]